MFFILTITFIAIGCNKFPAAANNCTSPYTREVKIKNLRLCVQTVSTAKDMTQGLSGRASMNINQGMVFDFSKGAGPQTMPAFWMKDMKFDLDFIWIKDSKIISIDKKAPAPKGAEANKDTNLETYSPPSSIDYVLEVNAGWADENGVHAGDEVKMQY